MRNSGLFLLSFVLMMVGVGLIVKGIPSTEVLGQSVGSLGGQIAEVSRVIDGDTFVVKLGGQEQKVRYIGVDTPETVDPHRPVGCYGHEASDEDKALLSGKEVELVSDVRDKDDFGRLLRYVYIRQSNGQYLFLNDFLVREGYARVDTIAPDTKMEADFTQAQQEAQFAKRGLWQKCQ